MDMLFTFICFGIGIIIGAAAGYFVTKHMSWS